MTKVLNKYVDNMKLEEDAELLKTIAHPVRIKLLRELYTHKSLNVTQLISALKIPQSTVSQHLSKMRGKVIRGNRKGLEVYYSIHNPKVKVIVELFDNIQ
ncbi:TPA: metalloregulator ArsR/SmtB family transcription factor [Bacillus tropicus]|uniref:ArsR/SmtB family transcription factor n=1 Tax=Bacillus cereus group TaxID=86661 RepID=UPI00003CB5C0|nr:MULTISPECIES: metalloregulator ArsR/SmtB family transcription factor [Bacillus cereus group]AIY73030.1 transcriptional repressor pagR [Bacillus cereus]AJI07944.1 transcriptional repressor pagR [Bacillus cereus G9241]EAL15963.1 transcriptional regulator, arsR family [Bacillus cereus G9241]QPS53448.1 winged helix-turn-helix transcriptional regulator [Bacillus tropicus]